MTNECLIGVWLMNWLVDWCMIDELIGVWLIGFVCHFHGSKVCLFCVYFSNRRSYSWRWIWLVKNKGRQKMKGLLEKGPVGRALEPSEHLSRTGKLATNVLLYIQTIKSKLMASWYTCNDKSSTINLGLFVYVIVRVHLSVSSRLRVCGVLMVNILNKCILSILVYSLFYRQTVQSFIYTNILAVFMIIFF